MPVSNARRPVYDWAGAPWDKVPDHLREPLKAYIEIGRPIGSGLQGLLENGPIFSVLPLLDPVVRPRALGVLRFLHGHVPHEAWGSAAKVKAWIERGGYARADRQ